MHTVGSGSGDKQKRCATTVATFDFSNYCRIKKVGTSASTTSWKQFHFPDLEANVSPSEAGEGEMGEPVEAAAAKRVGKIVDVTHS